VNPTAFVELASQGTPALDVQRLVDRLVGDPHRRMIGKVDAEPVRDLLGAPCLLAAPVGAASVAATDEPNRGPAIWPAAWPGDHPGEPVLHVVAERGVGGELGDLGSAGPALGMPLGVVAR